MGWSRLEAKKKLPTGPSWVSHVLQNVPKPIQTSIPSTLFCNRRCGSRQACFFPRHRETQGDANSFLNSHSEQPLDVYTYRLRNERDGWITMWVAKPTSLVSDWEARVDPKSREVIRCMNSCAPAKRHQYYIPFPTVYRTTCTEWLYSRCAPPMLT